VFSTRPLPYKSHSENTAEAMRVELEDPDNKLGANGRVYRGTDNDDDDCDDEHNGEDEADIDEVANKLIPSRLSLAKRVRESILSYTSSI
jgi:hypothetical protein